MKLRAWLVVIAGVGLLAGCGKSGSAPEPPREVRFIVDTLTDNPYRVVRLETANGRPHTLPAASFAGPWIISLLNAEPPTRGVFASELRATADATISLVILGELTKVEVLPAASVTQVALSTLTNPNVPVVGIDEAPEVRFEVISADPTQRPVFTATIGDDTLSYLACGDTAICQVPTMFYYEAIDGELAGAFSTLTTNDDQEMIVNLYSNGDLVRTATITRNNPTAIIQFTPPRGVR